MKIYIEFQDHDLNYL